jgi:glycosyltransferase involved in cell wall biosynthesis
MTSDLPSGTISIVIPTRNRPRLLRWALRSVQEQADPDIQVVVCDNSSDDASARVVEDHQAAGTVTYHKTETVLPMPDNWEAALTMATGEWIMFLTDDSYLLAGAVQEARRALVSGLDVVAWAHCGYFDPDWPEPARQNSLYIPIGTNSVRRLDSAQALRRLFSDFTRPHPLPKLLNSIVSRGVVERAISKQGRFFLGPTPDYSAACSVLLNTPAFAYLDTPLFVDGVTAASIGANQVIGVGGASRSFWDEFGRPMDEIAYLGLPTAWAGVAASLRKVARCYGERAPVLEDELVLRAVVSDLARLESNGAKVKPHWRTLDAFVARQGPGLRLKVAVERQRARVKWTLLRIARRRVPSSFLERVRGKRMHSGKALGFSDIEGAARVAAADLRRARSGPASRP